MAGRRVPVSRLIAAALVASAMASGSALAAGEWTVTPNGPAKAPGGTWTVGPSASGGTWSIGPAPESQTASPAEILNQFVVISTGAPAAPPVAPAAFEAPKPVIQLDPDAPAVKALAAAEAARDAAAGALADLRARIDSVAGRELDELIATEPALVAAKDAAEARVTELRPAVEKLRREAEARAAQPVVSASNPFVSSGGLTFAPVSGAVPTIDANLAATIDSYLSSKGSPLAGLGSVFVHQSTSVGLDPKLLVAIAGAETSFGTYGPSQRIHNPFGMGPGIVYPSWADSIASAARNLGGNLYKGSGLVTIAQIQRRWAPNGAANDPTNLNSHWFKNVSQYYRQLGGDPNGTVFSDRRAPATAIPVAPGVAPGIQGTVAAPAAYGVAVPVPGGGQGRGPAAVQLAVNYQGVRYVAGGVSPAGFDASGLVQFAYAKQGVTLPRTAEEQARVGTPLAPEQLTAGDVVFFADRKGHIGHVGMYIGNGLFIHAPAGNDVVKISSLYEPYFATQYAGARRY